MGSPRAPPRFSGEAWPSPEVLCPTHSRRRLLPTEKRLRLADAPERVPALADALLPLSQVAPRRAAAASPRPAQGDRARIGGQGSRSPLRGGPRQPSREDHRCVGGPKRGYETAPSASPGASATSWWTPEASCLASTSTRPELARSRRHSRTPDRRAARGTASGLAVVWADAAYTGQFREWVGLKSEDGAWRCPATQIGSSVEVWTRGEASGVPGAGAQVGGREDFLVAGTSA
jgi:hypothetical protein